MIFLCAEKFIQCVLNRVIVELDFGQKFKLDSRVKFQKSRMVSKFKLNPKIIVCQGPSPD